MTCSAWTVIGEENSYHTMHDHGRVYDGISTLVYLEVPETNVEDEPETIFSFPLTLKLRNQYYYENASVINSNPEVGKLLIFLTGGRMEHIQTKGIRQSFNVDYKLVADEKNSLKIFVQLMTYQIIDNFLSEEKFFKVKNSIFEVRIYMESKSLGFKFRRNT